MPAHANPCEQVKSVPQMNLVFLTLAYVSEML